MIRMYDIKRPKIIIYDDDNLLYYEGWSGSFEITNTPIEFYTCDSPYLRTIDSLDSCFQCSISNYEKRNSIELDPTTMKRIAKYNKEVEIEKLDEIIKRKKDCIQELDDVLQDKSKRVQKIQEYVNNIYNITLDDDGDYYD